MLIMMTIWMFIMLHTSLVSVVVEGQLYWAGGNVIARADFQGKWVSSVVTTSGTLGGNVVLDGHDVSCPQHCLH